MTKTIAADHVLVSAHGPLLSPGYLALDDAGTILDVGAGRPVGGADVELDGRLLMPGLVNCHAHTPMSLMRGVASGSSLLTMEGWLGSVRGLEAGLEAEMIRPAVLLSCAEMIRTGTVAFADQYFFAEEVATAVETTGLRATIAYGIVELGDDAARSRELAACAAFLARHVGRSSLVEPWVGPHAFFVDNTAEAIDAELALVSEHGGGLHAHFSTSGEEDAVCQERYGRSALATMADNGLLDQRLILAHGNTIPAEDAHYLARPGVSVAVNASVCMASGVPMAPVEAIRDAGGRVVIGSDNVCNNNTLDLFREMGFLGRLASFARRRPAALASGDILEMATVHGRAALGHPPGTGTLATGAPADVLALALDDVPVGPVGAQSVQDAIVYGATGYAVSDVMVAGRWLMRDRALLTVDVAAVRRQVQDAFDALPGTPVRALT